LPEDSQVIHLNILPHLQLLVFSLMISSKQEAHFCLFPGPLPLPFGEVIGGGVGLCGRFGELAGVYGEVGGVIIGLVVTF